MQNEKIKRFHDREGHLLGILFRNRYYVTKDDSYAAGLELKARILKNHPDFYEAYYEAAAKNNVEVVITTKSEFARRVSPYTNSASKNTPQRSTNTQPQKQTPQRPTNTTQPNKEEDKGGELSFGATLAISLLVASGAYVAVFGVKSLSLFSEDPIVQSSADMWINPKSTWESSKTSTITGPFAVFGISSTAEDGGHAIYKDSLGRYHFDDKVELKKVEKEAGVIYDKFNKDHKNTEESHVIISESPEVAKTLDEILNTNCRQDLISKLSALKEALKEPEKTAVRKRKNHDK